MKLSFAKKLTASYLFVVAVTLAFTGAYLSPRIQKTYLAHLEQSLSIQAQLIARAIPSDKTTLQTWVHRQGQIMGSRVTVIGPDGVVAADSERTADEVKRMDNHAG